MGDVDPFVGSGSTGVAALEEGFRFIGIDQDPHSIEIARQRLPGAAVEGVPAFMEADGVDG